VIPAQSVNEKLTLVAGLIPGPLDLRSLASQRSSNFVKGPGISKPYIGPGDEKEDPGLIPGPRIAFAGPLDLGSAEPCLSW